MSILELGLILNFHDTKHLKMGLLPTDNLGIYFGINNIARPFGLLLYAIFTVTHLFITVF